MTNLYSYIAASLQQRAAHPVLVVSPASAEQQLSGGQLQQQVARYAMTLHALGLRRGERLAVQVDKSVANIVLYLACLRMGAVYLPLNTAYQSSEIDYFLQDAQPRLLVVASERATELAPVARRNAVTALLT